ncbi:hypothetical protein GcC1_005037 [Golovinomyces cichoracearum]|uniref:Uncharacterized protein n=1 Tax=Golovinomyces cichoracearum TaxID=62708 RepID=A0A420J8S2_9PEZI|nr:hypothetical protein GcC1_005037 [Golovinomyces cichoracearum]
MGIPCSHRIKAKQENAQVLNTDDFDVHWWLFQSDDMPPTPPLETPNFEDILGQLQHAVIPHHSTAVYAILAATIPGHALKEI